MTDEQGEPAISELLDLLNNALKIGGHTPMDRFKTRLAEAHPLTKGILEIWYPSFKAISDMAKEVGDERPGNN